MRNPIPDGVALVRRGGGERERESPLDRPVITCEGACFGWVPHVRVPLEERDLAAGAANMAYAGSAYACTGCGTRRRYG